MMQSKAEKYLAAAKMAGKVSVTKLTSGDPLEAAENYHKAGKAFKVAGMHPQAMHAFEKAQRQYAQCGALSHAARRVTATRPCRSMGRRVFVVLTAGWVITVAAQLITGTSFFNDNRCFS